ncbi:MAG: hypothetical protein QOG63_46 [Thermoleophilaceae bacterium]|nr:hypothetical protein [Thermoleophilaceae bacterium]
MRRPWVLCVVALALAMSAPAAAGSTRYGDLTFPENENAQPSSWDYWWGAASLKTKSGNRYVVGMAFTSLDGAMSSAYQVWPLQGPYQGQSVMTMEGPVEWGHPEQPPGRFVNKMTVNLPATDQRLSLDTFDTSDGLKPISRWERIDLRRESYRLRLDQAAAAVHPSGARVRLRLNLVADMRTPLLAGGTGRWFYGVPEDYGYPSRAYQYQQGAKRLTGTIRLEQPDGSILRERVDPKRSILSMTHESNPKEAIPTGIALALSTQLHPRYFQSYNLQWPWELVYADLGNGAQLMFDLQTYHDTPRGTVKNARQPTYRVLSTLRLRNGKSVRLDGDLHAEHLDMRTLDTITSASGNVLASAWVQGWKFRVSYPGGKERTADGKTVRVPPFDLGLVSPFDKSEPLPDAHNNRLTQRVPFDVRGSYGGCPVRGFAWSELLTNWYGWEEHDPWLSDGALPKIPKRCGAKVRQPPLHPTGELNPPPEPTEQPNLTTEKCEANETTPRCEYDAQGAGGVAASGDPYGWTVTITRPGRSEPIVLTGHGGWQAYPCGTVRRGDHVIAEARPGSSVTVGNPGICF